MRVSDPPLQQEEVELACASRTACAEIENLNPWVIEIGCFKRKALSASLELPLPSEQLFPLRSHSGSHGGEPTVEGRSCLPAGLALILRDHRPPPGLIVRRTVFTHKANLCTFGPASVYLVLK